MEPWAQLTLQVMLLERRTKLVEQVVPRMQAGVGAAWLASCCLEEEEEEARAGMSPLEVA